MLKRRCEEMTCGKRLCFYYCLGWEVVVKSREKKKLQLQYHSNFNLPSWTFQIIIISSCWPLWLWLMVESFSALYHWCHDAIIVRLCICSFTEYCCYEFLFPLQVCHWRPLIEYLSKSVGCLFTLLNRLCYFAIALANLLPQPPETHQHDECEFNGATIFYQLLSLLLAACPLLPL